MTNMESEFTHTDLEQKVTLKEDHSIEIRDNVCLDYSEFVDRDFFKFL